MRWWIADDREDKDGEESVERCHKEGQIREKIIKLSAKKAGKKFFKVRVGNSQIQRKGISRSKVKN